MIGPSEITSARLFKVMLDQPLLVRMSSELPGQMACPQKQVQRWLSFSRFSNKKEGFEGQNQKFKALLLTGIPGTALNL